jgi:hypothetical protein
MISVIDKCNQALTRFGFHKIERIEAETINIVNGVIPSNNNGFTSGLQGITPEKPLPLFWYYLHFQSENNFNFLFGWSFEKKVYKWKEGKKKLSNKHIKAIKREANLLLNDIYFNGGAK